MTLGKVLVASNNHVTLTLQQSAALNQVAIVLIAKDDIIGTCVVVVVSIYGIGARLHLTVAWVDSVIVWVEMATVWWVDVVIRAHVNVGMMKLARKMMEGGGVQVLGDTSHARYVRDMSSSSLEINIK